jgi:copper chaperone CopZ
MESREYIIPNINCHHCIHTIQSELGDINGIVAVTGDPSTKRIKVDWDKPVEESAIIKILTDINYPPEM